MDLIGPLLVLVVPFVALLLGVWRHRPARSLEPATNRRWDNDLTRFQANGTGLELPMRAGTVPSEFQCYGTHITIYIY